MTLSRSCARPDPRSRPASGDRWLLFHGKSHRCASVLRDPGAPRRVRSAESSEVPAGAGIPGGGRLQNWK